MYLKPKTNANDEMSEMKTLEQRLLRNTHLRSLFVCPVADDLIK